MLCLDIKLVSRLRGVSSGTASSTASSTHPTTASVSSTSMSSAEKSKFRRVKRHESSEVASSNTTSDSEEESLRPSSSIQEMIRRNRSRSICVAALMPSSQLRQLHRRASHVATTDAIARRGVLSRRCYGSVEMLPQIEQDGADNGRRFRVENGDSPGEKEEMFGSPSTPILENPEYQTRWYFKYFLGKLHQNYIASDQERNPLFLSVVTSEVGDQCVPHYRVILWRRTGAQKISLPYSANKTMTIRQILSNFFSLEKLDKAPREVFTPELQKDLLLLEEQEGSVNFKFGVIYAREGQITDDEMLSNERGSPGFESFLEILGERIRLKGWDKYRGGLDVKGDMTGKESYYTVYAGHEVMYHVSTMLPYSKDNPQQLERKRHIGNDIVNIIYTDDPSAVDTFNPNCIRSQFTHVFAVVTTEADGKSWRVAIYCDENVPLFGPSLPCPPVFEDPYNLREFLLVKLINGEKATFDTPTFSRKRERTLDALLRDMYQEHSQDSKSNSMLNRRALSDVVETPGRRREETRAVEMVRVGQALKLEAIMRGLAPTSLATVGPLKPRPWEPRCIYPCVVVGRRLTVLQWKHNAAWTIWCSSADTDTVDGFLLVKEFTANETPSLVTMIESVDPTNEWTLCCGARHHFELITASGTSRIVHMEATPKPHLVAALDLREDEEPELLLCYNNTCHFQKLAEENTASTEFDFNWNSMPTVVACAFPYVIAFTNDTMEIRLIINGNLVHTIAMPSLNLITSKRDIFFATTAPEFFPGKCERIRLDSKPLEKEEMPCSPPLTAQSSSSSRSSVQSTYSQGDWKPIRIYRIPLQTLSRSTASNCNQRRCPSPAEPEIVSAPPTSDRTFLSVEPQRVHSRSCSSSPTPTPITNLPSPCKK
ncbi:GARL3 protein, partial [Acromyrmex insinuator]